MFSGVTETQLQKALILNPDGVLRLARFVGCESVNPYTLAKACVKHRKAQVLATRVVDKRAASVTDEGRMINRGVFSNDDEMEAF